MYTPLPTRPDIDRLKLRARELRDAVAAGNAQANLRVHRQRWPVPQDPVAFPLRNAQSVIAREHGFTNWARLKQYIDSLANPTAGDDERVPGQPHSGELLRRLSREKYPITGSQIQDILDEYRLGVLATFRTVGGTNFPNTVIDVRTASGESFIIKIQTRSLPGWSLRQEHRAIRALQRADEVPVSEKCELDESGALLPHPYLISNRLEGRQGRNLLRADQSRTASVPGGAAGGDAGPDPRADSASGPAGPPGGSSKCRRDSPGERNPQEGTGSAGSRV